MFSLETVFVFYYINWEHVKTGLDEKDYKDKYEYSPVDPKTGIKPSREQKTAAKKADNGRLTGLYANMGNGAWLW